MLFRSCLPRFNNKGFLHAYISYLTPDTGVVFVCGEREGFEKMQELAKEVKARLAIKGLLKRVEREKGSQRYSLGAFQRRRAAYLMRYWLTGGSDR